MKFIFGQLLQYSQENKPCKIIKHDEVTVFVKLFEELKWQNLDGIHYFEIKFIDNSGSAVSLNSSEIKAVQDTETEE